MTQHFYVLIVEDDFGISKMHEIIFTKSGFECKCAYSVSEAEQILTEAHFDLVILDLELDKTDPNDNGGKQIITWMVENKVNAKIIVVTGYVGRADPFVQSNVYAIVEKGEHPSKLLDLSKGIVSP
jgi:DNA-binding response OmpR family regulator